MGQCFYIYYPCPRDILANPLALYPYNCSSVFSHMGLYLPVFNGLQQTDVTGTQDVPVVNRSLTRFRMMKLSCVLRTTHSAHAHQKVALVKRISSLNFVVMNRKETLFPTTLHSVGNAASLLFKTPKFVKKEIRPRLPGCEHCPHLQTQKIGIDIYGEFVALPACFRLLYAILLVYIIINLTP